MDKIDKLSMIYRITGDSGGWPAGLSHSNVLYLRVQME